MRDFEGKVAVITGAANGMGRAFAERFAQEGMKVVLADIEEAALDRAVTELRRREYDVLGVVTNVARPEAVDELARRTIESYGKVHVVCNNAGVSHATGQAVWEYSLKDWQWLMGVNFWGVLNGLRTFVPLMLAQDEEAHIVNTSSMAGLVVGSGAYGATKHAVVSLTESLYTELQARKSKIGVSLLCPGLVVTSIATAERNRPEELRNEGEVTDADALRERRRETIEWTQRHGIDPMDVADLVLDGIRNQQFYLRTADPVTVERGDVWIRTRMENVLARRNPVARVIREGQFR